MHHTLCVLSQAPLTHHEAVKMFVVSYVIAWLTLLLVWVLVVSK